jgi:hypothetical protein
MTFVFTSLGGIIFALFAFPRRVSLVFFPGAPRFNFRGEGSGVQPQRWLHVSAKQKISS